MRIADIAVGLPDKVVTNKQLCAENPEWDMTKVAGRSGVFSRHIAADGETALDLAVAACRDLLSRNPDLLAAVDGLIMCTCLLYTSDAADDLLCVDLGGR